MWQGLSEVLRIQIWRNKWLQYTVFRINDNLHKFKKMLMCSWSFITKIDTGSKEHALNVTVTNTS